jgi:hypothetical protein
MCWTKIEGIWGIEGPYSTLEYCTVGVAVEIPVIPYILYWHAVMESDFDCFTTLLVC